MGEELESTVFFTKLNNGKLVPFEGFKPADIVIADELDETLYATLPQSGEFTMEISVTHKMKRRMFKAFHTAFNQVKREKRTAKRKKEKQRRNALKQNTK